jgi:hypothetical protein
MQALPELDAARRQARRIGGTRYMQLSGSADNGDPAAAAYGDRFDVIGFRRQVGVRRVLERVPHDEVVVVIDKSQEAAVW